MRAAGASGWARAVAGAYGGTERREGGGDRWWREGAMWWPARPPDPAARLGNGRRKKKRIGKRENKGREKMGDLNH